VKLDAHTHLGAGRGAAATGALLAMLDEYGIEAAVAFPGAAGLAGSPRQISAANRYVAEAARQHPDRLIGFATANPYHEDEAQEGLQKAAGQGLRGLKLHPPLQGFVLSNRKLLDPILAQAARLGFPVIIHTGVRLAGLPYVEVSLGDIGRLAQAFPEVTFIVAHMGWGGRDSSGIGELARDHANVWFDTAGVNAPHQIQALVAAGAGDRILYGSDFPLLHPKVELLRVELAELAPEVKAGILGVNAQRLLARKREARG
jgi:predicted TIM-barrel fold metal-dependent hydrolase